MLDSANNMCYITYRTKERNTKSSKKTSVPGKQGDMHNENKKRSDDLC